MTKTQNDNSDSKKKKPELIYLINYLTIFFQFETMRGIIYIGKAHNIVFLELYELYCNLCIEEETCLTFK